MNKILVLCISVFIISNSWGQGYDWVKQFEKSKYDNVNYIEKDENSNIYLLGEFSDTIDFDLDTTQQHLLTPLNPGSAEIYIAKYDSNLNLIYVKTLTNNFGVSVEGFSVSKTGEILISGIFWGSIDLDPSSNTVSYTNGSGMTAESFLVKLNSNGDYAFSHRFFDPFNTGENVVAKCSFSTNNEIIIFAFLSQCDIDISANTQTVSGSYIIKYDANGTLIWHNGIGIGNQFSENIFDIDENGDIYILGSFQNSSQFYNNTINLTAVGSSDLLLCKILSNGNLAWYNEMGDLGYEYPNLIKYNHLRDEIIISGESDAIFNFSANSNSTHLPNNNCKNGFIAGFDNSGNFIFNHQFPKVKDIDFDENGEIIVAGNINQTTDFISGVGSYYISPNTDDAFVAKLNQYGNLKWLSILTGKWSEELKGITLLNNKIYFTGTYSNTFTFDPRDPNDDLHVVQGSKIVIGTILNNDKIDLIRGSVFADFNQNCIQDNSESFLPSLSLVINPGNIIVDASTVGFWSLDSLPSGTYTITYDTTGNWKGVCSNTQTFTVTNPDSITVISPYGMYNTNPCTEPNVSINMPFMRPCFTDQKIYVNACNTNLATKVLDNAYVIVKLDSMLIPTSSSLPYTNQGYEYRFNIGNIYPGQCANFTIDATVSCNSVLGQTLCLEAKLFPIDSCSLDSIPASPPSSVTPCTLPWDKSSLKVSGWCQNDSVYFTITNTGDFGNGDMDCYSELRVYLDGQYIILDSIKLVGSQTDTLVFAGNGQTWRLEADQHPLHPGNSHPNTSVELCGDENNWIPNLINILPHDDAEPVKDIYCGVVTGSYDPNDKTGYPLGITDTNFISSNQKLEYVIRFQNTGTDTAFTVVIRDTLDMDFNIFSVKEGVSSHKFNFRKYGPRILEWTFYNILLPDSTTDYEGSNGFITFTVDQNQDLLNGVEMTNTAAIYFDFNAPVITNTSSHVINNHLFTFNNDSTKAGVDEDLQIEFSSKVNVYPIPFDKQLNIMYNEIDFSKNVEIQMFNLIGSKILVPLKQRNNSLLFNTSNISSGVYFIKIVDGLNSETIKVVKK